jgi:hypothetical protein
MAHGAETRVGADAQVTDLEQTRLKFQEVLDKVEYAPWVIELHLDGARFYLQVHAKDEVCNTTGEKISWKGRKWFLSPHMTTTEIVLTAFGAVKMATAHELREKFKYRGAAVFGPHLSVDAVADLMLADANQADDVRKDK